MLLSFQKERKRRDGNGGREEGRKKGRREGRTEGRENNQKSLTKAWKIYLYIFYILILFTSIEEETLEFN